MSVRLAFTCDGCFAEVEGTDWLRKRFRSFSGKDHGFGVYVVDEVESVVPGGWVAFDPYTQCTYCPSCWTQIESGAAGDSDEPPPTDNSGDAASGSVVDAGDQAGHRGNDLGGADRPAVAVPSTGSGEQ